MMMIEAAATHAMARIESESMSYDIPDHCKMQVLHVLVPRGGS